MLILAFLFGSVATKKQRNDSDIDIAIWLKDPDDINAVDRIEKFINNIQTIL